jgi:DNA-binding PucR family transcriptional regulator
VLHSRRHTLVYRMKRVEELTGRHLDHAELWCAMRTLDLVR